MTDKRYAVCIGCGEEWNISAHVVIGTGGYICPKCTTLMRRGIPLSVLQARAKNKDTKRRYHGKS